MERRIEFFVPGVPKGQPRTRAVVRHNGRAGTFDPGTADDWKRSIAIAAGPFCPEQPCQGGVMLAVLFELPRPKRLMRARDPDGIVECAAKPDIDNALKAVMDILTQVGFWRDDAQVVATFVTKAYHAKAGRPGAHIGIALDYSLTAGGSDADQGNAVDRRPLVPDQLRGGVACG